MLLNKISNANRLKVLLVSIYDSFIIVGYRKSIKKEVDGESWIYYHREYMRKKECTV